MFPSMKKRQALIGGLLLLALIVSAPAWAAVTGKISGIVIDKKNGFFISRLWVDREWRSSLAASINVIANEVFQIRDTFFILCRKGLSGFLL